MKMKLRFQIVTHQVKRVNIIIIGHTKRDSIFLWLYSYLLAPYGKFLLDI